jgi:subtilisin family serine protease
MNYRKLSSDLLMSLHDYEEDGTVGLERHATALTLYAADLEAKKPARAVVFVNCDSSRDFSYLAQEGIQVNQRTGAVRTALVALEQLGRLSEEQSVSRIVASRYLQLLMDVAPGAVRLPAFRTRTGLTGQNVIIGIVDSGIDSQHPAFAGRILRIWDQNITGPGVTEGAYGFELSGQTLRVSVDMNGHGTHVAGIASGTDPIYEGVAPRAELVIVKSDLSDAHISDGIRYIFRVAAELNRPAVVNLSLGGHWDAHDGTDSLSQSIDQETGQGRIVCCAAGNEGNDNIRARASIQPGAIYTVRFQPPPAGARAGYLNGWYAGNASLEVSVQEPGGSVTPFQAVIVQGNPTRSHQLPGGRVAITTQSPDPVNGDLNFLVQVQSSALAIPLQGVWTLRVHNTGLAAVDLDVWAPKGPGGFLIFTGKSVRDDMKIGSPGASLSAVTVASHTTKVQWTDLSGAVRQVGLTLNTISDFSSPGPLRNGTPKPDVAAPGAMIAAALSSSSNPPPAKVVAQGFQIKSGTSMATPFVTGLVALLLERDPQLTPASVKAALQAVSTIPGQSPGTFHPKWGHGPIDAGNLP